LKKYYSLLTFIETRGYDLLHIQKCVINNLSHGGDVASSHDKRIEPILKQYLGLT